MMKLARHAALGVSLLTLSVAAVPAFAQNTMAAPANGQMSGGTSSAMNTQEPAPSVDKAVAESETSGTQDRAHTEMAAVIKKLTDLGAKPFHTLSVEEARNQPTPADAVEAVYSEMNNGKPATPESVGKTENISIPGADGDIAARVYWPEGAASDAELPVVVYFHGGGWVVATIDTYDASPRAIANQAQAIVVSVEYSKGPEHKFPAAHDDAIAAYKYVVENAGEWNGDTDRIAVAGESAGGNLAINVAIDARDNEYTVPDAILAVYPVAGSDMNTQSYIDNQNASPLGKADVAWFVENYLNNMDEAKDPRIDLVNAELNDLPPTTIIAAEIDPLLSEGEVLRDKLDEAGVEVTYQRWDGTTHEFFGMGAVVPEAKDAQALAGTRLKAAFTE